MYITFVAIKILAACLFTGGVALFIWTVFKGFQLGKSKDEKVEKIFDDEMDFYERVSKN